MAQLNLTNFINISVSVAQAGVGSFNTSNIAIFTDELPGASFPSASFQQYLSPTQVGIDFGTNSKTYQMANAIFSQSPNILTGGGQLVVIPIGIFSQTLAFSGVAASGAFVVNYRGAASASIPYTSSAASIQTILQAVPGLSEVTVTGSIASESLVVVMNGCYGGTSPVLFTITPNTLQTSGSAPITVTPTASTAGETLGAAITRTASLVQYFGILAAATATEIGSVDLLAAAAIVQVLVKIMFIVSYNSTDIQSGGMLVALQTGLFSQSRGLYYGDSTVLGLNALLMAAAYAGRALSVNFAGSNTTQTMNLKSLASINPDPTMTQTIYGYAQTAGADVYASFQGVSSVACFGANSYFDQVYNLLWFTAALQVAGFNYLAQASTKIPQTDGAMDGLKGAYRQVCEQAITNQYCAPGSWTSSTTFGNSTDLIANVAQRGYYIYSQPVALQAQANRAARQAPIVQIALKQAGAIQSSSVIVNINA